MSFQLYLKIWHVLQIPQFWWTSFFDYFKSQISKWKHMRELLRMARGLKDSYSLSNKQQKMSVPTDHPVVWLFCYIINTNKNRHLLLLVITTKLLIITVSRQFPHIRSLILSCWTGKRRTRLHLNWLALGSQELR